MAKRGNDAPKYTKLTAAEMRDALPKLRRRLEELKKLDVSHLEARGDPKFEVIETRANHALAEVFGPDSIQYNDYHVTLDTAGWEAGGTPKDEVLAGYQEGIDRAIANFETAIAHFEEELQERRGLEEPDSAARTRHGNKVFVVHGHDDAAKTAVARFVEQLGLEAVVLHEQANEGRTVIEKFEKHAGGVTFAIVLLTPDDVGYPVGKEAEAQPRARQNVILEFGFFVSALGRDHVVALTKGNVEIPSDLHGLLYERMDDGGAWRFRVAQEMRAVGIEVDMNRIR